MSTSLPIAPLLGLAVVGMGTWLLASQGCSAESKATPPIGAEAGTGSTPQEAVEDQRPSATPAQEPEPPPPPRGYGYTVKAVHPHDPTAFTQGLLWHGGFLYESTGQYGESTLRRVDPTSGSVLAQHRLAAHLFAEGIAVVGDELWQLTWQNRQAIVYSFDGEFRELRRHPLGGEGWGLTYDGERLILSDGQARLRFYDPLTFRELGRVPVTHDGRPVHRLNELEWIEGEVWANVWQEDHVLRIDPETGRVTGVVDLSGLIDLEPDLADGNLAAGPQNVLNGIAWDPAGERLFVTGKDWPALFEIEVIPAE